jgi:tetratricopeptide (TPR) repeat protein
MALRGHLAAIRVIPAICFLCMLPAQATAGAARQTPATRAREAYARAVELQTQGNQAAALSLLWEAAGLAPDDADIQNRLGEALERIGALDAAVEAYRLAVSGHPAFPKTSNNLILALVKSGKGAEAIERARALVTAAPGDPDRHFTLGLAQSEQDVTEATKSFRRVLELEPRHVLARYNLALVLRRADRLPEALDELRRALAIDPRPEIHYTMGVIYWHQGDLDRAASALRAAVAAEPGYADAHYTLGAVLKAGRDWAGAAASLGRAIALRPDLPSAHYTLAQVLQLRGDDSGARTHFAEGDRLRHEAQLQQEAGVWTAVGTQKLDRGDLLNALDCFRRATTVFEGYAPAHYQMGRTLERLGQHEVARAAFARARQLNPSLVPPRDSS